MEQFDYLIVGGGLFGSVFAHEMLKRGKTCLVVERRHHTGGNLYCRDMHGITVHAYGAHIFHTADETLWRYVTALAPFDGFINSPVANYRGEIYNLPFNMNTFTRLWGVVTPAQAKEKIAAQAGEIKGEPKNLEEQAIKLVGRDVYERLIKGYTQKQWGRPAAELPAFIIRRLPLRFTYDNNYFPHPYQGIPRGGYNPLINALLAGAEVELGVDFNKNRQKYRAMAKKVLYTGQIDAYFDYRFGALEYRSLVFKTEYLPHCDNHQGVAVMNYTGMEVEYTRVIEHKHFSPRECPGSVITYEYPAPWRKGAQPYYPVNDTPNNALYLRYAKAARGEKNTIFGGRLAGYEYCDMDKTIAWALELARAEGME